MLIELIGVKLKGIPHWTFKEWGKYFNQVKFSVQLRYVLSN